MIREYLKEKVTGTYFKHKVFLNLNLILFNFLLLPFLIYPLIVIAITPFLTNALGRSSFNFKWNTINLIDRSDVNIINNILSVQGVFGYRLPSYFYDSRSCAELLLMISDEESYYNNFDSVIKKLHQGSLDNHSGQNISNIVNSYEQNFVNFNFINTTKANGICWKSIPVNNFIVDSHFSYIERKIDALTKMVHLFSASSRFIIIDTNGIFEVFFKYTKEIKINEVKTQNNMIDSYNYYSGLVGTEGGQNISGIIMYNNKIPQNYIREFPEEYINFLLSGKLPLKSSLQNTKIFIIIN